MAKIMLVEDDNSLREIYQARLMAEGYETVAAKDGEEALALVGEEKPDLIILDIMMPKISGFDALDILRSTPATKYTKVIMMSALSQAEDKARAEKLGANKYLVKSQVTLEDIVKTVKEVLESDSDTSSGADAPVTATPTTQDVVPVTSDAITPVTEPASTPQPDLSNAEAVVSDQAVSTADEEKTITNEENKEMNEDTTNSAAPVDPTAAPADPTVSAAPTDAVEEVSTQDSQVSSDPSPLTDPSLADPVAPAVDNSAPVSVDPVDSAAPVYPTAAPADPVAPAVDNSAPDPSLGGTKVVDPVTDQNAQNSHLQELLAQEESKEAGTTPPPAPAA